MVQMFVTLEGSEGAGKSSVAQRLTEWLKTEGIDAISTREPGSGTFGQQIREVLLHGANIDPRAELMLYLADRAEHVSVVIQPALQLGQTVICDRYTDSTLAYQGYARGFDLDWLRAMNRFVTDGLAPDLTLLLDLDPSVGLARITNGDRLDREPLEFHASVRKGFLTEAKREPGRWILIDASRPLEEVFERCREAISAAMRP